MAGWSAVGGQTKSPYARGEIDPDGASITHQGPTGSSSGSAVAVAAGFAPLSIGTELIGSVVTPASRAGLYSIKLTPESVDNAGTLPGCPQWDAQGPYAKTTHDVAIISAIMQARDPETYLPLPSSWKGLKLAFADPKDWNYLGYPSEILEHNTDFQKQMDDGLYAAQDRIEREGGKVVRTVSVPQRKDIEAAMPDLEGSGQLFQYQTKRLWPQYLAEFEGVPQTLEDLVQWHEDHADLEYTKRNNNVDAIKAASESILTKEEFERNERVLRKTAHDHLLEILDESDADVIVGPGDSEINMIAAYAGWTVGSVPAGFADFNGRPWSLHVLAPPGEEGRIFRVMAAWEATFPQNVQPPPKLVGFDASL
jgi:amidase